MDFRQNVQDEAYFALMSQRAASGDIAMRLGKTLIGLRVASNFTTVIVSYPNKSILKSWITDSKEFNINIEHITFTTHRSLHKHKLENYECVIIDEIDQLSLANWEHIASTKNINHIKGLSGTMPLRGYKQRYISNICPIVYTKKLDETIGYTSKDYRIYVHMVEPSYIKNIPLKKGGFWSELAKINFFTRLYEKSSNFKDLITVIRLISGSPSKFNYALDLINKLKKGFLFLETIDQCDRSGHPSYHGKNPDSSENLELFLKGEIEILVSINQLKAGITVKNLDTVVLLHSYSSNNKAAQKIGRCLNYIGDDQIAQIHIVCLAGTMDEKWTENCLKEFDQTKITYV